MVYDAGDSFISDDEEELCPLCVEEMDISDKNFKPCPCGYQVCQFCYNNIRQNPQLNGRCPACRRPYDDDAVEYKIITPEEWRKDHEKQARKEREKKQRQREKKESEQSSRKHLSGMRVIQKNLVYVIGLNPNIPTEELHNTLRTDQFFGQYGKIQKIVINRRNNANGNPGIGVYVTFARKEDAAKCIAAVDGSLNETKYLRAAYGTTKYCSSYLRGQTCPNPNCMFLHEPGEEADSYTRQDLSTFQVAAGGSGSSGTTAGSAAPAAVAPVGGGNSATAGSKPIKIGGSGQNFKSDGGSASSSSPPNDQVLHHHPGDPPHNFHLPATVSWATKASPSTMQAKLHTTSLTSYPPLPVSSASSAGLTSSSGSESVIGQGKQRSRRQNQSHQKKGEESRSPSPFEDEEVLEKAVPTSIVDEEPVYIPCPEPKTPDVAVTYMHDSLIALADPNAYGYSFSDDVLSEQKLGSTLPLFSYAATTATTPAPNASEAAAFYEELESYLFKPNAMSLSFRAQIDFMEVTKQQQYDLQYLQLQQQAAAAAAAAQQQQLQLQQQQQLELQQQQLAQQQLAQQQQLQQQRLQQQQRAIQEFGIDPTKTATPPPPGLFASQAQVMAAAQGSTPSPGLAANYASLVNNGSTNTNNSQELLAHLMKGGNIKTGA